MQLAFGPVLTVPLSKGVLLQPISTTRPSRAAGGSRLVGAERDEDGSVIALRSISRDGPSRAYLGGRGVPAKSLSGFTNELLTLHGQNDQLRLMRPDEQRGALDRFAAAGEAVQRYRKLRDAWLTARRDLVDRRNRARELAQEADRLKFALNEIDTVDPQPGRTWRWSPTSPGFPN